jgi:hypothetical protein
MLSEIRRFKAANSQQPAPTSWRHSEGNCSDITQQSGIIINAQTSKYHNRSVRQTVQKFVHESLDF